ncbi:hypothetical protein NDA11_003129 [Ustilago hordei]|uniref:Ribosome assembly protein 3 n=1 Tax=Ustilago hordei TaxID=120017 RepID=I2FLZ4_USTHO|nr:uncharacterized protein UHO2_03014 [Ustilago hordei]KAJ1038111.1 hypothetical protein NDA10_003688 [Ustilago hordei]KAJ1585428.1 hypothetical protein NDA15_006112 [Ustilago hordei]KAJ1588187.1 hypothetical protein NDA12_004866 [Ustilago hordei]KAJ1592920.1 hypothetical protein NDA11_003129 [Ustilago hordei]KAJ1601551.1 hypothetical protein NDA14_003971 [Ustilago hordei]
MAVEKSKSGKASAGPRRRRQRKTRTLALSSRDDSDSSPSSSSSSNDDSESDEANTKSANRESPPPKRAPSASSSLSSSSSSSSANSTSSSESNGSDPDSPAARKRTSKNRTTAPSDIMHASAAASSSGKHRHVFRLTPEPELDEADSIPVKKRTSHREQAIKALEPAKLKLPSRWQHIVNAMKSSPSSKRDFEGDSTSNTQQSKAQQERRRQAFRSLWLKAIANEFEDELDSIRTREPSLGADGGTRLPLFIDALAYGSELFTAPSGKEQVHGRTDDIDELALTANL